jgi:uncharacterized phage protein (TIGR01671 family)
MREIKFRVWWTKFKTMEPVGGYFWEEEGISGNNLEECCHSGFILMQYTGLKDKNGKEIYEGDIVRFFAGHCVEDIYENALVKFEDMCFLLVKNSIVGEVSSMVEGIDGVKDEKWLQGAALCLFDEEELEVIGNIHENKDLLCGK